MAKESSIAPKERINVTFKPALGNAQEEIELPLKLVVLGDFTQRPDDTKLEDRRPISIDKNNFDEVLGKQGLTLNLAVPNRLQEGASDSDLALTLKFDTLSDFGPASLADKVPELKKLMELRDALVALKGPLGNTPAFRRAIESVLSDDDSRTSVLSELGLAAQPTTDE